jgi:AraC-like DNA-binding protein
MTQPLASFPITSTRDTDEAESILSRELVALRFDKVRDPSRFGLEMNGVHLGRTMIGHNRFDTETVVDAGEVDRAIVLTMGGTGAPTVCHIDAEPVACARKGAILSPSKRVVNHRPAGGGVFVIRAAFDAIEERLREVMDRRLRKPIVFDRSVDLLQGMGAHTCSLMRFVVDDIQRDKAVVENPLLRAGFDDALLTALVALPNNYSHELMDGHQPSIVPGLVRRAEEFLEARATEPVTISDVVAECGCSRRALFDAFRRYRGYTPMQFLADSRIEAARLALGSPSPGDTVSSIAYACGFSHPGRFSIAYRERFGESPSETLRRA